MTTKGGNMSGRSRISRGGLGAGMLALVGAVALLIAVPLQAKSAAIPAGNLVLNPGFEEGLGAIDDTTTPPVRWESGGNHPKGQNASVWKYVAGEGYERPTLAVAAKIRGGANFLSGGHGSAGTPGSLTKTASQSIDVSAAAVEIDAAGVAANLSAYLGGYSASDTTARVDARFLGADGAALGSLRVGPVTRDQRAKQTTLVKRTASAAVPKGTRSIAVVITMYGPTTLSKVYAYADNVSLVLTKAVPAVAKSTMAVGCTRKTLVVTVKPAAGAAVSSVTFLVNGKAVAVDKKAPYTARIGTAGLAKQLKVTARVKFAGKTEALTKAIKRC
jgi:hypothetical protein